MSEHTTSEGLLEGSAQVNVFTTPTKDPLLDPEPVLVAMIGLAKHEIVFGIYSFTLPDVADALIAAHARGVTVTGLADAGEWARTPTSQLPRLAAAGLDVLAWGSGYSLMHLKVLVVDGARVALGSSNWTTNAEHDNEEVMVTIGSTKLAATLRAQILNARLKAHKP